MLAAWQATIVDESGNIQSGANVQVLLESSGALGALFSDRDGASPISNPITVGSDGFVRFYAAGTAYRINATNGAFTRTWRHVPIGLLGELDTLTSTLVRYERTAAEIAASVTPTNYAYLPGDVRRYGAVGDDSTDCTAALQAAINQAYLTGGQEVYLPLGIFRITSNVTGVRATRIRGASREWTVIRVVGAITGLSLTESLSEDQRGSWHISDLTIQGDTTTVLCLLSLTTAGMSTFERVRFYRSSQDLVRLSTECHLTGFTDCVFQGWSDAAVEYSGLNSIQSFLRCQFQIISSIDGTNVTATTSCCIKTDDLENLHIDACEANGDELLGSFIRFTGDTGRCGIRECYAEGFTAPLIVSTSGALINGLIVENCDFNTSDSTAIDLSAGSLQHTGIYVRNIRRAQTSAGSILNPGSSVQYEYVGTPLDGSMGHVTGFTSHREMRRFGTSRFQADLHSRFTIGPYTQTNAAASQTNVELTGSRWVALRDGSITGVVVRSNAARTAGTLTVEVYKSGVATGLTAVLDGTNTTAKATTQNPDVDTFSATEELYIVVTTDGSWAPTTADIYAYIEVEF